MKHTDAAASCVSLGEDNVQEGRLTFTSLCIPKPNLSYPHAPASFKNVTSKEGLNKYLIYYIHTGHLTSPGSRRTRSLLGIDYLLFLIHSIFHTLTVCEL